MKKRKLPEGFSSWVQVYDDILRQNPELLLAKTIWFIHKRKPEDIVKPYKLSVKTLLANCWLELQEFRLTEDESVIMGHRLKSNDDLFHQEWTDKAIKLLFHLKIND